MMVAQAHHDAAAHKAWIARESKRRIVKENPNAPSRVWPLEQFPTTSIFADVLNEKAQKRGAGEACRALEGLIAGSCNGWVRKPTSQEMEQAIKGRHSTPRTRSLAKVVLREADTMCIAHAEATGAFSLQDLAWWIKETGFPCYERIKWLNAIGRSWWLRRRKGRHQGTRQRTND